MQPKKKPRPGPSGRSAEYDGAEAEAKVEAQKRTLSWDTIHAEMKAANDTMRERLLSLGVPVLSSSSTRNQSRSSTDEHARLDDELVQLVCKDPTILQHDRLLASNKIKPGRKIFESSHRKAFRTRPGDEG